MAARQFLCRIQNVGQGPLTRVRDQLEHGSWTQGFLPSQSAQIINPGETKTFQSESDGFLTGTQGSVTYSGLTNDPSLDFLKVSWDLPYWAPDSQSLEQSVTVERARYDPDLDRNSFEWQNRDQRPSSLVTGAFVFNPNDQNVVDQLQELPNVAIFGIPLANHDLTQHMGLDLSVGGTISDTSLTFPSTPPPQTVSSPLKGSTVPLWLGHWSSANVMAFITSAERNALGGQWGLMVSLAEKGANGPKWFPSLHVPVAQTNVINRVSNISETAVISGRSNVASGPRSPAEILTEESVHQGDYVTLGQDASLEINEIRANNAVVGHCLFYRRPTKSGIIPITGPHFAEMMFTPVHIA
jgi:hypothetical protein